MIKNLMTFCALALLFLPVLSGCSLNDDGQRPIVRFALESDQIESWEENSNGLTVHLNTEGQRRIYSVTHQHPCSELQIYAGRILVQTMTIKETLKGKNLFIAMDDDTKDRAMGMLPTAKKSD